MHDTLQTAAASLNEHVLVYTFANSRHFMFVAPFVFFALRSNPGVFVEVCVDSVEDYLKHHDREFYMLRALLGGGFEIRQSEVYAPGKMLPHTMRFIEAPRHYRRYTYITDVDIPIAVEGFARQHLDHMAKIGLPYSNTVRPGTSRLTGLHFTETDAMFPIPGISDIDLAKRNDEEVLYEIMTRKGLGVPTDQFRPVHGVHFSLNRPTPLAKDGSGIGWTNRSQWRDFKRLAQGVEFDALWLVLSPEFKDMVNRLRAACEAEWPNG